MTGNHYPALKNQRVLITGGATGIGAAIAEAFLQQSAHVAVLDRDASSGEALREKLANRSSGPVLHFFAVDVCQPESFQSALREAMQALNGIDVLINNVAHDLRHQLENLALAELDALLAVNLRSHLLATQAVIPAMRAQKSGVILNISSNSYRLGLTGYPVYTTAKSALCGLTRSLARELGTDNIRVNAVLPGWVMTERQKRDWVTPEALAQCLDAQCLKAAMQPADITGPILFLCTPEARFITGQELVVDGGRA